MASNSQKTFKLRKVPLTERKAFHVARFDVPKFDITNMAQPVRMVRQGFEDAPPPPELESNSKKFQQQQNELRKKAFLIDDASKKVKLAGQPEYLEGRYFLFVSDPTASETFNVIPVRDTYRFQKRPELKQISIEEAESVMSRREKAAPTVLRGTVVQSGADEDGIEPDVEMGGLSVYGYRVRDEDLDTEIRQGQEEAGEENDFKEKFDDDNPEDIVQVASTERQKMSKEAKQVKKWLKKKPGAEEQDSADDSEDSEDEFAKEVQQSLAHQPQALQEDQAQAKNKKRKAEEPVAEKQPKRQKTSDQKTPDPDFLTRDEMLEEVKKIFLSRGSLTKNELAKIGTDRFNVKNNENNKSAFLHVFKTMVKPKGDGSDLLIWKADLFTR